MVGVARKAHSRSAGRSRPTQRRRRRGKMPESFRSLATQRAARGCEEEYRSHRDDVRKAENNMAMIDDMHQNSDLAYPSLRARRERCGPGGSKREGGAHVEEMAQCSHVAVSC